MNDSINFSINNEGLIDMTFKDGEVLKNKTILYDDFLNCILSVRPKEKIKSGLLPKNCIFYSENTDTKERYICIEHTSYYADVQFKETKYSNFSLPKLVFGYYLNHKNAITGKYLGVVEDIKILRPETKMYHYPFGNVMQFGICTGSNSLPRHKQLYTMGSVNHFILSMPNNNDGYSNNKNQFQMEQGDLFEHLKDKTPDYYYTDVLVENGKTLSDFLNL